MTVSFTGLVAHRNPANLTLRAKAGAFDTAYLKQLAQAHETGGFDRVLVGYGSTQPDGLHLGTYVTTVTEKRGVMLAHRPGFVAPTLAARTLATIDQLSNGRASVHIISGGDDAEQQRDGDFLKKDERYARTDEYVGLLRRLWTSEQPFDHDGNFYKFKGGFVAEKPVQKPHIPIYFGGSSDAAIEAAGRHADIYALFGETLEQTREKIARVRAAAASTAAISNSACRCGRSLPKPKIWPGSAPKRSLSVPAHSVPAWAKAIFPAHRAVRARHGCCTPRRKAAASISVCGQRLRASPAPRAIPPRWWAPARKWRMLCSTITILASPRS